MMLRIGLLVACTARALPVSFEVKGDVPRCRNSPPAAAANDASSSRGRSYAVRRQTCSAATVQGWIARFIP